MKTKLSFFILLLTTTLVAQEKPNYLDNNLPVEQRVNDLISRMTLEEKISQMVYNAPAIERLGIPEYNWWNECLHGVGRNGLATVFPQAIGLAAMWDKDLMFKVASVISDEARAKYNYAISIGERGIYQGLTFWTPNINIFRDPRWGRGMETYGEDPFLTGQMAVQFIKGLQGNNPKYFKAIATSKHFAVHSGPEPERHSFNAEVTEYDLRETYLPAFKKTVIDADVQSVMCAYNSLRGKACCANDPLLNKILRDEWGFKGYVVSDCWGIKDIWEFHKQAVDAAEASAMSVKAGTDLNCGVSFPHLSEAIKKGMISESEIDIAVTRLFTARFKLGMFDPVESVPFNSITMDSVNSKRNQMIALEATRKSIVLLKNQNKLLPLQKNLKTIAVIGPNADDEEVLYGNYNGFAKNPVTPLMGIINKVGKMTKVLFEPGCDLAENMHAPKIISGEFLFTTPEKNINGLTAEYFSNPEYKGEAHYKRIDSMINFKWWFVPPYPDFRTNNFSVRWTGYLVPPVTGEYKIGGWAFNELNLELNGDKLISYSDNHRSHKIFQSAFLEKGKTYKIELKYRSSSRYSMVQLFWAVDDDQKENRALESAKNSDAIIMFMGISPRLEGEEMDVPVPGFLSGDRLTMDLPEPQQKLIKKICSLKKPVVLVLLNGSALSINWENENVTAVLESWYGGEAAGTAIADVIFGDYNPSGRLPITFYKSIDQLPDFKDYNMKGRTYRYFDGDVLYPFGFGLSYSSFEYSNLRIDKTVIGPSESAKIFVEIKNNGEMKGEEVVQLYLKREGTDKNDAFKTLRGFERIELNPGEIKTVEFVVNREVLEKFIEGKGFVVEKGEHTLLIGASSNTKNLSSINVTVNE